MKNKHLLYALMILCVAQVYAAEQPKKDLFQQLSQEAEEQYKKSSGQSECNKTAEIKIEPMTYDTLTTTQKQQLQNVVVKKSIFFSSYTCRRLLKANPVWQQIKKEMPQDEKNRLFRKLLSVYNNSGSINNTFSLACAVCVGADPNQRPDKYPNEHHVLWFACSRSHKAFFDFLVNQGADLDLSCHCMSGREFAKKKQWPIPSGK